MLVAQAHGQAVKLGFGNVFNGPITVGQAEFTTDAGIERHGSAGLGIGFGSDAEHGHRVAHGGKPIQHLTTHTACGGIRAGQLWMGLLQGLQCAKEPVVLGIGQLGGIQHVVQVCMVVELS